MAFFRGIYDRIGLEFQDIEKEYCLVDAMALNIVRKPWDYDVTVMENMFGDILSDLGAGIVGGIASGEVTFFEGGGLHPAGGVIGMGFTAINKQVLKGLGERPFDRMVLNSRLYGEDLSFCHRAREAGFKIMCDPEIQVGHLRSQII